MIVDSPVSMMDDKVLLDGQYETEQELSRSGEKYSVQIRRQDVAEAMMAVGRRGSELPPAHSFHTFSPMGGIEADSGVGPRPV